MLTCRGCGGPRHVKESTSARWFYECSGKKVPVGSLNEFHKVNVARQHEAFAPAHSRDALLACVGEETGELCAALLGVTGEKKRKAHLTKSDVTDACADAATYVSLLLDALGFSDLEKVLAVAEGTNVRAGNWGQPFPMVRQLLENIGGASFSIRVNSHESASEYLGKCWVILSMIALAHGANDFPKLLGDTFNMVSERAGSKLRTTLGQ